MYPSSYPHYNPVMSKYHRSILSISVYRLVILFEIDVTLLVLCYHRHRKGLHLAYINLNVSNLMHLNWHICELLVSGTSCKVQRK